MGRRTAYSETAIAMLTTGQVVEVEVRTVAVFGVFCRHEDQEILVLIPEISWIASFSSCHQFAEPGDRWTVKIIHGDVGTGKISAGGQHAWDSRFNKFRVSHRGW